MEKLQNYKIEILLTSSENKFATIVDHCDLYKKIYEKVYKTIKSGKITKLQNQRKTKFIHFNLTERHRDL